MTTYWRWCRFVRLFDYVIHVVVKKICSWIFTSWVLVVVVRLENVFLFAFSSIFQVFVGLLILEKNLPNVAFELVRLFHFNGLFIHVLIQPKKTQPRNASEGSFASFPMPSGARSCLRTQRPRGNFPGACSASTTWPATALFIIAIMINSRYNKKAQMKSNWNFSWMQPRTEKTDITWDTASMNVAHLSTHKEKDLSSNYI